MILYGEVCNPLTCRTTGRKGCTEASKPRGTLGDAVPDGALCFGGADQRFFGALESRGILAEQKCVAARKQALHHHPAVIGNPELVGQAVSALRGRGFKQLRGAAAQDALEQYHNLMERY